MNYVCAKTRLIFAIISVTCFSFIFNQESYKCNIYRCSQVNLLPNQCIYTHYLFTNGTADDQKVYDISLNCEKGSFCPPNYSKNTNITCEVRILYGDRVEGESCTNNTDCASNICNNQKCQGLSPKAVCTNNLQCGIGYYCGKLSPINNVYNCLEQKTAGQECQYDWDCANNMGCRNQTCVPYFSLADGSAAQTGEKLLCQSMRVVNGYCVSTKLLESSEECTSNNGTLQTKCRYQLEGAPNTTDSTFESTCQCSRAYPDKKFCEYDTHHPNWQKLINSLKEYFYHDAIKKHTTKRENFDFSLRKQYLTVTQYPQFKDADNCAIDIELASSFHKLSKIILGIILLILL